jgi:hypothetical protein
MQRGPSADTMVKILLVMSIFFIALVIGYVAGG